MEHDGYRTSVSHLPLTDCPDTQPHEYPARAEITHIIPWSTISQKKDVS
jgi:hypothetical protein